MWIVPPTSKCGVPAIISISWLMPWPEKAASPCNCTFNTLDWNVFASANAPSPFVCCFDLAFPIDTGFTASRCDGLWSIVKWILFSLMLRSSLTSETINFSKSEAYSVFSSKTHENDLECLPWLWRHPGIRSNLWFCEIFSLDAFAASSSISSICRDAACRAQCPWRHERRPIEAIAKRMPSSIQRPRRHTVWPSGISWPRNDPTPAIWAAIPKWRVWNCRWSSFPWRQLISHIFPSAIRVPVPIQCMRTQCSYRRNTFDAENLWRRPVNRPIVVHAKSHENCVRHFHWVHIAASPIRRCCCGRVKQTQIRRIRIRKSRELYKPFYCVDFYWIRSGHTMWMYPVCVNPSHKITLLLTNAHDIIGHCERK